VEIGRIGFNLELDSPKNLVLKTQNQGSWNVKNWSRTGLEGLSKKFKTCKPNQKFFQIWEKLEMRPEVLLKRKYWPTLCWDTQGSEVISWPCWSQRRYELCTWHHTYQPKISLETYTRTRLVWKFWRGPISSTRLVWIFLKRDSISVSVCMVQKQIPNSTLVQTSNRQPLN
jgi:hypothetical protein